MPSLMKTCGRKLKNIIFVIFVFNLTKFIYHPMQFSAAEIAQIINGKLEGNTNSTVASFGKIEEANEGQLSFLANPKYEDFLYTTKASVVIINNSLHLKQPVAATLIRVPDAYSAFALLLDKAQQMKTSQLSGIQDPVFMHPTAKIGENVYLGAFVFIGENAIVGNNVKIFPGCFIGNNVTITECIIGPHVSIGEGSVLSNCIISNSIIQSHCKISNANIDNSMVGNFVEYSEKYKELNIGDFTVIVQ